MKNIAPILNIITHTKTYRKIYIYNLKKTEVFTFINILQSFTKAS